MQLTVQEASKFLDVSESTVTRWIKQRGLPAQHVGGQFRFNRAELLEWAAANQVKVSLDLFDSGDSDQDEIPSLAEAMEAGGVFYDLEGADRERALRALVRVLPLPESIDRELLFQLFIAREASASTAIGGGIAMPHARNPLILRVERPLVALCYLARPVDFAAMDGKPVQLFFSLICPTMRSHLQVLSRLSFALHDAKFKDAVMRQASRDEILGEARRIEAIQHLPESELPSGKAMD